MSKPKSKCEKLLNNIIIISIMFFVFPYFIFILLFIAIFKADAFIKYLKKQGYDECEIIKNILNTIENKNNQAISNKQNDKLNKNNITKNIKTQSISNNKNTTNKKTYGNKDISNYDIDHSELFNENTDFNETKTQKIPSKISNTSYTKTKNTNINKNNSKIQNIISKKSNTSYTQQKDNNNTDNTNIKNTNSFNGGKSIWDNYESVLDKINKN